MFGTTDTKGHGPRTFALLISAGACLLPWIPASAAGRTLDDLMRTALVQSHDIKAARAQVGVAVGRLKQAGLWPNPRLA